jgi:hypothetical protein
LSESQFCELCLLFVGHFPIFLPNPCLYFVSHTSLVCDPFIRLTRTEELRLGDRVVHSSITTDLILLRGAADLPSPEYQQLADVINEVSVVTVRHHEITNRVTFPYNSVVNRDAMTDLFVI